MGRSPDVLFCCWCGSAMEIAYLAPVPWGYPPGSDPPERDWCLPTCVNCHEALTQDGRAERLRRQIYDGR